MLTSSLGKLSVDRLHPESDLNSSSSPAALSTPLLLLSPPISGRAFPRAPSRSALARILLPPAQNFPLLSSRGPPAYLLARGRPSEPPRGNGCRMSSRTALLAQTRR